MNAPDFRFFLTLTLLVFCGELLSATREDTWNFKVYLDDQPVGYHRFLLTQDEAGRKMRSEARFDVKFLMFNAYAYSHQADETWRGDCLAELRAETDDNGDVSKVNGNVRNGTFRLLRGKDEAKLPDCVMTFAYWHPRMLEQQRLLNPQNGEYTEVRIAFRGEEPIPVRGKAVTARRYHLESPRFQIDLWYADDRRWVALDSRLENGRLLRYRIE